MGGHDRRRPLALRPGDMHRLELIVRVSAVLQDLVHPVEAEDRRRLLHLMHTLVIGEVDSRYGAHGVLVGVLGVGWLSFVVRIGDQGDTPTTS